MTHNANDRPKFYTIKQEAHWLFHNAVAHPVVGVIGFAAALLHHTGGQMIPDFLLNVGEALHDWSVPQRERKKAYQYDPLEDDLIEDG